MYANSDFLKFGYQIRHWFNPRTKERAIEFIPRKDRGKEGESVIVMSYAEQAEFHRRIGANVVPPGERYSDDDTSSEKSDLDPRFDADANSTAGKATQ